jgi:nitrogen fixation protein FixH
LLTGFFVGLVFLNAGLLYISTQGLPEPIARWWLGSNGGPVYSGFSGVVSHGENAAKAVSSELSETHRESQLGWRVEFSGLERSGLTRLIEVRVQDRTGLPVDGVTAELSLQRPGAATPALVLPLSAAEPGVYMGSLTLPAAGRWLLELHLRQEGVVRFHNIQELVVS